MHYFDNAATSFPKPEEVYSFMDSYYRTNGMNIGRGTHTSSLTAKNLLVDTRRKLLKLMNAENKKVVFTPSATEAINLVLQGIEWRSKMNVYISSFEHNAVLRTLHYLKQQYDIEIHYIEVDKEFYEYDLEAIKHQFQLNEPNVIIMSHASNVIGKIAPINEICEMAKKYKAISVIDMAQTAGLLNVELSKNIYDYVIFAGHKTLYGPFGIAGVILKEDSKLKPLIYGGTGFESANLELPLTVPERFEVGSHNVLSIAGLSAAVDWIDKITIERIRETEQEKTKQLIDILKSHDNVRVLRGPYEETYIGVVSCTFQGYSSDNIGMILDKHNVAVRTGLHCSPNAHRFIGTFPEGTVRFSVSYFTNDEDFDALDEVLSYIEDNS